MAYPYNPKIAPAIGNGLGGFPQKAAVAASRLNFPVLNQATITYEAGETGTKSLGFTIKDIGRVTVCVASGSTIGYSTCSRTSDEFLIGNYGSYYPQIRVESVSTEVKFGILNSTQIQVSSNSNGNPMRITVTEYDFLYSSLEFLTGMLTVVDGADLVLAKPIEDPTAAIITAYRTGTWSENGTVSQSNISRFSSTVPCVSLPYGGGNTGFCAALKDKNTVRYGNWSSAVSNSSFTCFILSGVRGK